MTDASLSANSQDDLQFTTAEPAAAEAASDRGAVSCTLCSQPIGSQYYALAEHVICPACCQPPLAPPQGRGFVRLVKAAVFGIAAGLVGAAIWFAIRRVANMEIGLVAVLVGFMVGKAVHKGSNNKGGLGYQLLAVVITYCCIVTNYVPDTAEALLKIAREKKAEQAAQLHGQGNAVADNAAAGQPNAAAQPVEPLKLSPLKWAILLVVAFVLSLALPFLMGFDNLIGLLIIGFALWEAWKFNARREPPITGPYEMGASPAA